MLVVLLRVQLNIIGGYLYLDNSAGRSPTVRRTSMTFALTFCISKYTKLNYLELDQVQKNLVGTSLMINVNLIIQREV